MQGSPTRRRLTISMIMVVIAFLAIAIAGAAASYRDRNRPDFMLAIWCTFAGVMAGTSFSPKDEPGFSRGLGPVPGDPERLPRRGDLDGSRFHTSSGR